jgi:hypothetical protein
MNSTIHCQIGLRLRKFRRQQRRSQRELSVWLCAFHAPITRDMIANWETGRAAVLAVYIPVLAWPRQRCHCQLLAGAQCPQSSYCAKEAVHYQR